MKYKRQQLIHTMEKKTPKTEQSYSQFQSYIKLIWAAFRDDNKIPNKKSVKML